MRARAILVLAIVAVASGPPAAFADGLPLPVEDVGPTGIAQTGGDYRFVTVDAGSSTLVERIEQDGGVVSASTRLAGDYTIPAVGLDGSPGGLSADGATLVLISPRRSFPRQTTEFVRFDTESMRRPHEFRLDGDFSFDAISPDGRTMYVIHYVSPRDPTEYHVRAYDLEHGRLVPGAIVDPNEPDEEMYGYALSRETSPDGRWAYTLYMGTEHPFVHALDTERGAAVCIDLDSLEGVRDMYSLGLDQGAGGSGLVVTKRGALAAMIDTATFAVSEPPTDEIAGAIANAGAASGGDSSAGGAIAGRWVGVGAMGIGVALAAMAVGLAWRRRQRVLA